MTTPPAPARRVVLHVGAPKTGTSFVQSVLFDHREALAAEGLHYPADRFDAHFLAALDLLGLPWGGLEREAVGAWDRLAEQVRAATGTVVVSHEVLAVASRAQAERALASFGEDSEVHLVLSARDLVRQVPAEWQENVKHRRTIGFDDFLAAVRDPERSTELASWFWGVQEVPDVLDRWGATLPPEQVHLVTVPRPGSPPELLWERFAGVMGLDVERHRPGPARTNASLGVPEAAFVRRLNERVNPDVPGPHYRGFVRELLAHRTLGGRPGSPRLELPREHHLWAAELSERWIAELAARGYDVVGDLAELRPDAPGEDEPPHPDHPDLDAVVDAAVEATAALVGEAGRLVEREHELERAVAERDAEVGRLRAELDRAYLTPAYRARRALVARSREGRVAGAAYRAYRRLRGSSSPEA